MRRPGLLLILSVICIADAVGDESLVTPDGWRPYAARDEIAPRFFVEQDAANQDGYLLGLAGRASDAVDGRWIRRVGVTAEKQKAPQWRGLSEVVRSGR